MSPAHRAITHVRGWAPNSINARVRQAAEIERLQAEVGWLEGGDPVLSVLRYVQRDPLRPGLVTRADSWPSSSLGHRGAPGQDRTLALTPPQVGLPPDRVVQVNRPQSQKELAALRRRAQREAPFGREDWGPRMAKQLGLHSTLRPRGRPAKSQDKGS